MSPSARNERLHGLLVLLFLASAGLGLAYSQKRVVNPRHEALRRHADEERRRLDHADSALRTAEAMDLGEMREALAAARERLRTVELVGSDEGPSFLDSRSLPAVAALQGQVSRHAVAASLVVHRHAAAPLEDERLVGLVVRDLELRGRFNQLVAFVESLASLPHRIAILSLDLRLDPAYPGQLRALLRYSI
jgi:Tfp pilus assembly protein PilO